MVPQSRGTGPFPLQGIVYLARQGPLVSNGSGGPTFYNGILTDRLAYSARCNLANLRASWSRKTF
jgi:hypothetical protein